MKEIIARDEADQLERDEMYVILEASGYPPREVIDLAVNHTAWSGSTTQTHAEVCDDMNQYRDQDKDRYHEQSHSRVRRGFRPTR